MKKLLLVVLLVLTLNMNQVNAATAVTGIEQDYEGTTVTIIGSEDQTLLIDGVLYESGYAYSVIGHHVLKVYEDDVLVEEIDFTIHPNFGTKINLLEQRVFYDSLALGISNEGPYSILIDGARRYGRIELTDVGYYLVKVLGSNGYRKGYKFTLLNSEIDLLPTSIIYEDLDIDVGPYKKVIINDTIIYDNVTLDKYGYYTLEFTGVGGYKKTLFVGYLIDESDYSTKQTSRFKIKTDSAEAVILDDVLLVVDKTLTEVGYYHIIVAGLNGYVKEFDITIVESKVDIIDHSTLESFKVGDVGGTLFLNGLEYEPKTKITAIGDYVFKIVGVNGYERIIHFYIRHDYPIDNYTSLDKPVNLNVDVNKIYVNGKQVKFDYRITKTGTYEIRFEGAGDFTETLTISYLNRNDIYFHIFINAAIGFTGIVFTIYGIIFWRRSK